MKVSSMPNSNNPHEDIWSLIKQLRFHDVINAIKQTTVGDFQHLANVARGRQLNLETIVLLAKKASGMPTARATAVALAVVALVVAAIFLIYPMGAASPFLNALSFTNAGPAAGSHAASVQPAFGVSALFSTLQSAAMAGYGVAVVSGVVRGAAAAGIIFATMFAAYRMWATNKYKST